MGNLNRLWPSLLVTAGIGGMALGPASASPAPVPMPKARPLPAGAAGQLVRDGADLVAHMPEALKGRISSNLTCTNCHLNGGTQPEAAPWVGVTRWYPAYRPRSGKVDTLTDRINDCVERSLNGQPLPAASREMRAILAYMDWLSQDVPASREVIGRGFGRPPTVAGDPDRGHTLYQARCAACHGADGSGQGSIPPLWGPRSFTVGAGMGRWRTAAPFIRANMPFGQGHSLSEQEAVDLATFIDRQPRPDFAHKAADWPKGGKPSDSPY